MFAGEWVKFESELRRTETDKNNYFEKYKWRNLSLISQKKSESDEL